MESLKDRGVRIGWACSDITPDRPVQLDGQFHERISERVRDPITVTALAIEAESSGSGEDQAILMSFDLIGVPLGILARIRGRVAQQLPGFDTRRIVAAATHTHTAPVLIGDRWYPSPRSGVMGPSEYSDLLVERAAGAAVDAWRSRRQGAVSRALGHAVVGHNRRVTYTDGSARMYGETDDPAFRGLEAGSDPGVEMLFTWAEGVVTGVVAAVACPSQVVERERYVSADYWSATRRLLREKISPSLFVLPLTSAAGDQSPRDLVRRGRGEPDMHAEAGLEELGARVADAVARAFARGGDDVRSRVVFQHAVETVSLPAWRVPVEQANESRAKVEELKDPVPGSEAYGSSRYHRSLLERHERQPPEPRVDVELHTLRIGDTAFTTNPFELYLSYGLRIKARSPAYVTFVAQLACGVEGYLPTAAAVAGKGYSALSLDASVGPEGGDTLVEASVAALRRLFPSGYGR